MLEVSDPRDWFLLPQYLPCQHVCRQIRLFLHKLFGKLRALYNLEDRNLLHDYQLSLLQITDDPRIWVCPSFLNDLELLSTCIGDGFYLWRYQPLFRHLQE